MMIFLFSFESPHGSKYLSGEVGVSNRIQELIECLLVELIIFIFLNLLLIPHLSIDRMRLTLKKLVKDAKDKETQGT